jgi:uncharacterized protein YecE (DUF72 family)
VLKGSRLITHARRIEGGQALQTFLQRAALLGPRLSGLLWQLPPTQQRDIDRLQRFLAQLPAGPLYAMEFRHPSWDGADVDELLAAAGVARVAVSVPGRGADDLPAAGPIYVRFHGLEGGYSHDYTRTELEPWAEALRRAVRAGRRGFAFFNNDGDGRAPEDAIELAELLAGS